MWRSASVLLVMVLAGCAGDSLGSTVPAELASASDSTFSFTPAPTPSPTMVPSREPTAVPSRTPSPAALAAGPATVAVNQLRVRVEPALEAPQVTYVYADNNVVSEMNLELHEGMPVWLLDAEPVTRDGLGWRKVAVNNTLYNDGSVLVGWIADQGADGTPWLLPFSRDCPLIVDATIAHLDLDRLRWMSLLGPACFGDRSVSFTAYWPELPPDAGLGGLCLGPEPRWLLCTNIRYAHVNVTADTSWTFPVYAPAGPETVLGPRGRWLLLSGHFDDPAAGECAAAAGADQDPDALEMFCRTRFVLESAEPVSS